MNITTTYKGTLNGIHGIWCGFKPDDVVVEAEIKVYHPENGKVFEKDGEIFDCVILKDGENIEDYKEVDKPADTEEME